ncbi:hypothetical protein BLNAU_16392 [Blattamonas nauphoetae]|uniref:Uncharacterized protein n=1 Tax=Blattamonas nauphoetae TaxID=2049346 RepID=A0ABQ9X8B2_9EUKA|nr:hypothetical protein BLNAU_16392 [Blattamonas nauphoetae]
MVGYTFGHISAVAALVGESHKDLASAEGVELVVNISFNKSIVDTDFLAGVGAGSNELEQLVVLLPAAVPHGLSVVGIIPTRKALLVSVVHNWDGVGDEDERVAALQEVPVALHVQESLVVVVADERPKHGVVDAAVLHLVQSVADLVAALLRAEHVEQCVVDGIVQLPGHDVGVSLDVVHAAIEDLTEKVRWHSADEEAPEVLVDVLDSIHTEAIEVEGGDQPAGPLGQLVLHPIVLGVEIGQVRETAILNFMLVVVILNIASGVVVGSAVERVHASEVLPDVPNMVNNDVNHHPDVLLVARPDEVLKVVRASEVVVD